MGLLTVALASAGGVLADQWKEYFYCPSMDDDVLMCKGEKRAQKRGFNNKGSENLITNGSMIVVNEGQCMIIVEQGAIVDVCAEAGAFQFKTDLAPTIFEGKLGQAIVNSFEQWKKRVAYGGDTGVDQRIYYFNTKDIIGNKYGTANPIPYRVVDANIRMDMDVSVRCFGEYSYRLVDPVLFYKKIAGNTEGVVKRDKIDSQLKSELLTALQPAFAVISEQGIRYSALPGRTKELRAALNNELSESWGKLYGIELVSIGVNSVTIPPEDQERIKRMQEDSVYRDPAMGAAAYANAGSQAMLEAAKNQNAGPMMAFAGMNMAGMTGSQNMQGLYQMAGMQGQGGYQSQPNAYQMAPNGGFQPQGYGQQMPPQYPQGQGQMGYPQNMNQGQMGQPGQPGPMGQPGQMGQPGPMGQAGQNQAPKMQGGANSWTCSCGNVNTGKFCSNCGKAKPEPASWTCSCGNVNTGKFCSNCGKPRA